MPGISLNDPILVNSAGYGSGVGSISQLSRQELNIINKGMTEFFTPVRGDYSGFDQSLLAGAHEHILSSGLHATIWPASGQVDRDILQNDNERSVLLVHGWGGNSAQLAGFVQPLLATGKHVVAVDAWAHGFSPGVESNCIKFAEGIAEAQMELGPFNHAVGHSLGAAAILVAVYAGCHFDSAVLISPPSILLVMEKFLAHKGGGKSLLEPFIQMSERYVGKLRSQADTLMISKSITMPFLLIHDQMDRRCPIKVSEALAADGPDRRLTRTNGLGHNHIIQAPEVIEATVNYLSQK